MVEPRASIYGNALVVANATHRPIDEPKTDGQIYRSVTNPSKHVLRRYANGIRIPA